MASTNINQPDTRTSPLQLRNLSYSFTNESITRPSAEDLEALHKFMEVYYNATAVKEFIPFMVVWCRGSIPEPSKRPFTIAGLAAIWLIDGVDNYPPDLGTGDRPRGKYDLHVDRDIVQDLWPCHVPKAETLRLLMERHFPGALAISYLSDAIVVELPELSPQDHRARLYGQLPRIFGHSQLSIKYHNGSSYLTQDSDTIPALPTYNGTIDNSDYVKITGAFTPGAMLSTEGGNSSTAGVLIEKGADTRLTMAMNGWEEKLRKSPSSLGRPGHFLVKQGDARAGTVVGRLVERVGESAIGLAALGEAKFVNGPLDVSGEAKTLLHSDNINFGDEFFIETFVGGMHSLKYLGLRLVKEQQNEGFLPAEQAPTTASVVKIALTQGIYANSAPEVLSIPAVREGICGAAIFRKPQHRKTENSTDTKNADTDGAIAGFVCWSNLASKHQGNNIFCLADSTNQLIAQGWKVRTTAARLMPGRSG